MMYPPIELYLPDDQWDDDDAREFAFKVLGLMSDHLPTYPLGQLVVVHEYEKGAP